ncbi:MAG: M1 family peptidase, partial [Bacteroidetes bacterium]|nr:M1 family peptidase [Bacteroidota bacterium]
MRQLILLAVSVFSTASLFAQDLYMPRDVTKAFQNNTRSLDGKPGKNYWQNHARYTIHLTALPPDRN